MEYKVGVKYTSNDLCIVEADTPKQAAWLYVKHKYSYVLTIDDQCDIFVITVEQDGDNFKTEVHFEMPIRDFMRDIEKVVEDLFNEKIKE